VASLSEGGAGPRAGAVDTRPLILHVVYRFATGGLENGVVNLINRLHGHRHAVLALTEVTEFRHRISRSDVQFISMNKAPGPGFLLFPALYRAIRALRPDIIHTRNLAALEVQLPAWLAGVPVRLHGEHGRDLDDLDGRNRRHQRVRRFYSRFVDRYVTLSRDLAGYLTDTVGLAPERIEQIYNGVDTERFKPVALRPPTAGCPFAPEGHLLIGSVGRMQGVKNPLSLAQAFVTLLKRRPEWKNQLRLVMAGDGPLRERVMQHLASAGVADCCFVPGDRSDIAAWMQGLDIFVLPSLAEGISNTVLEAMATGLPVLATRVGGNEELIRDGETGLLVPAADDEALAAALERLVESAALRQQLGAQARLEVQARFSLSRMVADYGRLYDNAIRPAAGRPTLLK